MELAAKDLSLCDFRSEFSQEALITLQLDHVAKRSHFLTFTEHDHNKLLPCKFLNDTVVDFWVRWIAHNELSSETNVLTFTSHFYTTLI